MSFNLEEFKTLEKIKLSYLKHRGNILPILKDLGWPEDKEHVNYVKKVIKKFKGKEGRDVATLISHTLMQQILLGYESRISHLMEILEALEGRDKNLLSVCCEAPVKPNPNQKDKYICLSCKKKEAEVKVVDNEDIVGLKLDTIEQLRKEDAALVAFAEKMGYTNKEKEPNLPPIRQNVIVFPGEKEKPAIAKEIEQLPPMTRDILISKLQKEILKKNTVDGEVIKESKVEEKKDNNGSG